MEQKWKLDFIMVNLKLLNFLKINSSKDQLCKLFDIRKVEEEVQSYKNLFPLEMNGKIKR